MLASNRTWLASYHLRGVAQTWYYTLEQDVRMPTWKRFKELCHLQFGPPVRDSRFAELGRLQFRSTVQEFTERLNVVLCHARNLDAPEGGALRGRPSGPHPRRRGDARTAGPSDDGVLGPGVRAARQQHHDNGPVRPPATCAVVASPAYGSTWRRCTADHGGPVADPTILSPHASRVAGASSSRVLL
jgi:hypothetical protein